MLQIGPEWRHSQLSFNSPVPYSLVFEAVDGAYGASDKAIDDITWHSSNCAPLGDCDFEAGLCGWTQVSG